MKFEKQKRGDEVLPEDVQMELEEMAAYLEELRRKIEEGSVSDQQTQQLEKVRGEFHDQVIESLLELSLIYGAKRNEGTKGVILEINIDELPEDIKEKFLDCYEADDQLGERVLAAKVIKVASSHGGLHEARMQTRAYDLVSQADESEHLAKIPMLRGYSEIEVKSEMVRAHLEHSGVKAGEKVEVLLMDFIPGEDLATHIFRRVLKTEEYYREMADRYDFDELQSHVANKLGYERPRAGDPGTNFEKKVYNANESKLFEFMRRNGIMIDREIIDRSLATLEKLRENGIYHNDIHPRNIMIETDEQGKIVDVYVIDFATAGDTEDAQGGNDFEQLRRYRSVSSGFAETKKDEVKSFLDSLHRLHSRAEGSGRYKGQLKDMREYLKSVIDDLEKLDPEKLKRMSIKIAGDQKWWELVGAEVLDLGGHDREKIRSLAEKLRDKASFPYVRVFWQKILNNM